MRLRRNHPNSQAGFTLVELLTVMGLFAVLVTITTVSLVRPQTAASSASTVNRLLADLKSQQLRAMAGDGDSASSAQPYGLYIETTQYTLFKGSTYSGADADNFVVAAGDNVNLSTTFPSTQVLFSKGTGEVSGFTGGSNTITVTNAISGEATVVTINRYGAISVN